jgi:hypothetical protein
LYLCNGCGHPGIYDPSPNEVCILGLQYTWSLAKLQYYITEQTLKILTPV